MPAAHGIECNWKHKSNCSQSEIRDKINQTKYAARKNTKNIKRNVAKNTEINTMTEKNTRRIKCSNLKRKELVEIAHTPRVLSVLNRCVVKESIAYFSAALSNFNSPLIDTFFFIQIPSLFFALFSPSFSFYSWLHLPSFFPLPSLSTPAFIRRRFALLITFCGRHNKSLTRHSALSK